LIYSKLLHVTLNNLVGLRGVSTAYTLNQRKKGGKVGAYLLYSIIGYSYSYSIMDSTLGTLYSIEDTPLLKIKKLKNNKIFI